jgi:hypothetical protein
MIVTLDGERLTRAFPTGGTLQELIDEVRREHLGDRLVVSVAVDGLPLLDQELSERLDAPLGQVGHVELISADTRQLVADSLCEVADRLRDAGKAQEGVADDLTTGNVTSAVNCFNEFLQTWQICQKSIADCSGLLGEDLTALESGGRPVREHLDGLAEKLREMRDALEARDMVALADTLRYEIPDTCQSWHDILKDLAAGIAARAGGASANAPSS